VCCVFNQYSSNFREADLVEHKILGVLLVELMIGVAITGIIAALE
jgi:Tfp pilus assembly protein FimT